MTREQARKVRERQLQGKPVTAGELQTAIFVLSKRRNRKFVLPILPRPVKEQLNAGLLFRLGLAIGQGRVSL